MSRVRLVLCGFEWLKWSAWMFKQNQVILGGLALCLIFSLIEIFFAGQVFNGLEIL